MSQAEKDQQKARYRRNMTVAHIREPSRADSIEVMFLESARFYRLFKSNAHFGDMLNRLREAMKTGRALAVSLASPDSDTIEDVG